MNVKHTVGNLIVTALPTWLDVTHDIEADCPPFTLARNDGVGVLQFSTAAYEKGKLPNIKTEDLRKLSADFALSRELGSAFDKQSREQPILAYGQSFNSGTQFIRVWYCSNGQDVALVTYVCEKGLEVREIPDCETMVAALRFAPV